MPRSHPSSLARRFVVPAGRRRFVVPAGRRRFVLPGLLTAAAVFALTAAASSAVPTARPAATPACQTGGLVTWLNLPGDGAAGSIVYTLEFTNLSGHRCTLHGFPGVSAINLRGRQVGKPAVRVSFGKAKTITLKNGAGAEALLKVAESGNFPPATCGPVTAAGLRVFPPNQKTSRTIPFPFGMCSKGSSNLSIRAVGRSS
jgi:hypothetical protein